MRTRLFRALAATAFAILPFAALAADDKTPLLCPPTSTIAQPNPSAPCTRFCQTPAVPQAHQNPQFTQPPVGDVDPGFSQPPTYPPSYTPSQVVPAPQPTLEQMIAELKTLRDKEKELTEAIREKIKAQRKAIDDAEHELNGQKQEDNCYKLKTTQFTR